MPLAPRPRRAISWAKHRHNKHTFITCLLLMGIVSFCWRCWLAIWILPVFIIVRHDFSWGLLLLFSDCSSSLDSQLHFEGKSQSHFSFLSLSFCLELKLTGTTAIFFHPSSFFHHPSVVCQCPSLPPLNWQSEKLAAAAAHYRSLGAQETKSTFTQKLATYWDCLVPLISFFMPEVDLSSSSSWLLCSPSLARLCFFWLTFI